MFGCRTDGSYQAEARLKLNTAIEGNADGQLINSVTNLPASIREHLGSIADSGGRFAAGCEAPKGVLRNRFLVATKTSRVYAVAVEHGGVSHYWNTTEFTLDQDGKVVSIRISDRW